MLKNRNLLQYTHLMKIQAKRRLLLTGTTLQNNLLELMSLLSFVIPFKQFSAQIRNTFSRARRVDKSSAYYQEQARQAKQIMAPFTLQRLKLQVLSQLPAKVSSTEHCQLTDTQWTLYRGVVERLLMVNQGRHGDELNKRMDVMDLRKATNHPLLLRHHYTDHTLHCMVRDILKESSHTDAAPNLVWEDMSVMSDLSYTTTVQG
ncbi:SWI/SNF-related matrix-associated actin-dependent regulator of chromatin subfamily A containing DEAD/H box 1A-like [Halichondria panicea]|uniref:SWI/SNF-related matrix-associated actin-dependent regulator of chromatin subfamily A containing DEAD/H box 1A-like n=1 Tax=Halichondria panicea TaxID=6063 RepID=UPI00312B81D0